jgi:WD40 repeat protein
MRLRRGPLQTSKDLPVVFGGRATAGLITNAAMSPDGRRVAAASASTGTLAVWDVPTGRLLHANAKRFRGFSEDLEFSPDERWVLAISSDTVARAWSAEAGRNGRPAAAPSRLGLRRRRGTRRAADRDPGEGGDLPLG